MVLCRWELGLGKALASLAWTRNLCTDPIGAARPGFSIVGYRAVVGNLLIGSYETPKSVLANHSGTVLSLVCVESGRLLVNESMRNSPNQRLHANAAIAPPSKSGIMGAVSVSRNRYSVSIFQEPSLNT